MAWQFVYKDLDDMEMKIKAKNFAEKINEEITTLVDSKHNITYSAECLDSDIVKIKVCTLEAAHRKNKMKVLGEYLFNVISGKAFIMESKVHPYKAYNENTHCYIPS
jgi:hypothetical protein